MKVSLKKIFALALCLCLVLSLTACGDPIGSLVKPNAFDKNHPNSDLPSFFITNESSQYELHWDREMYRIYLRDKETGEIFCNVPQQLFEMTTESGDPLAAKPIVESSILVNFREKLEENFDDNAHAYSYYASLKKNTYTIEKTPDNLGFKITYYFDSDEISVPVTYTLLNDGLKVSINPEDIAENENFIKNINFAPYFASVPSVDDDAYLFYPSGTGAIIEANNELKAKREYFSYVFGQDALQGFAATSTVSLSETVRLPVFGAVDGDRAILGVISEGADIATMDLVFEHTLGLATVYPTFHLRGFNYVSRVDGGVQYSKEYAYTPISVCYYPLTGEDANYVGMADKYREHLINEKGLTDKQEVAGAGISFIGGTQLNTSFLGMPTTEVFATTTLTDMGNILTDLSGKLSLPIVADLKGFGSSGIDPGQPAGNLEIADTIGDEAQMKKLAEKCKALGVDFFLDYDMMHFTSDGLGLTVTSGGSALGSGYVYTRWYSYELGSSYSGPYTYLIGREELPGLANKAADYTKSMNVGGISFSKITSRAYSDHYSNRTIGKANMGNDVSAIINNMHNSGLRFLSSQANEYAAINADVIIDAPISSSRMAVFDYDVPFYQLVFKGYTSMYGYDINMTTDRVDTILRCIEGGSSLKYTLINNYDNDLLCSAIQIFNSLLYEDNVDDIIEQVNTHADYYKAIEDAHIINHIVINEDVRKVVYDNGVTVIVNYSDEEYVSDIGTVGARNYIYVKE